MKNKFKNLINKIKRTITNKIFILDSLFLIGLFIIIFTNFRININFGLYFLGATLICLSIYISNTNVRR
ncbi:hypothetical protein AL713_15995 [Clostridium botulinum]|nr:hypothetical protein AL713_15995 [Clostridium botulinum]